MSEPNHEQIRPLLAIYRDLSPSQRQQADAHLAYCSACARELAAFQAMDRDLQALRTQHQRRFRRQQPDTAAFTAKIKASERPAARLGRFLAPLSAPARLATGVAGVLALLLVAALFAGWFDALRDQPPAGAPIPVRPSATATVATPEMAGSTTTVAPAISPTPPRASDFPNHQQAVFVAPADDLQIPQAEFTRLGITVLPTLDALLSHMEERPAPIVYLHPAVFRSADAALLQQLYQDGVLIVVLNVPASEIGEKLPALSGYDDLRPETFADKNLLVAAAAQFENNGNSTGHWTHRDFYPVDRWWHLVYNIERQFSQTVAAATVTRPAPLPTAIATTQSEPDECDVPRPAVLLPGQSTLDGFDLTIVDPLSSARCTLATRALASTNFAAAGDTLFYPVRDTTAGTITVWAHPLAGAPAPLSFTTTPALGAPWFGLAISPGGERIAWATFGEDGSGDARFLSTVWLGDLASESKQLLWQETEPDTLPPTIEPLYFWAEENAIVFARRPYGIGGVGPFAGRYSGLYSLSLAGGEPEPIFECASPFSMCLNDVDFDRRLLAVVADNSEQPALRILDFDGATVATHAPGDANYVGQPLFNSAGDVAFISATLVDGEDGVPTFQPGAIRFWPAPYTAEPQTLAESTDTVFDLWSWFDATHLLAGDWSDGAGLALLTTGGEQIPIAGSGASRPLLILR